jgi:hypothetical protein
MTRTFTFNRPIAALLLLPLLLLFGFSILSLVMEFGWGRLVATLLTGLFFTGLAWLSMMRRLTLGPEGAVWRTPGNRVELKYAEVKGWGKVRYRNFHFLYLTRLEGNPFAEQPVGTTADTLVIQLRPSAWEMLSERMKATQPDLAPKELAKN